MPSWGSPALLRALDVAEYLQPPAAPVFEATETLCGPHLAGLGGGDLLTEDLREDFEAPLLRRRAGEHHSVVVDAVEPLEGREGADDVHLVGEGDVDLSVVLVELKHVVLVPAVRVWFVFSIAHNDYSRLTGNELGIGRFRR